MNENKLKKEDKMTNLAQAVETYMTTAPVTMTMVFNVENKSFTTGETVEGAYTVSELVNAMSRQPQESISQAIDVLAQLTAMNDERYDMAYWSNVATAVLGIENAQDETGLNL
jgi:glucose-6-phosphate isomerase